MLSGNTGFASCRQATKGSSYTRTHIPDQKKAHNFLTTEQTVQEHSSKGSMVATRGQRRSNVTVYRWNGEHGCGFLLPSFMPISCRSLPRLTHVITQAQMGPLCSAGLTWDSFKRVENILFMQRVNCWLIRSYCFSTNSNAKRTKKQWRHPSAVFGLPRQRKTPCPIQSPITSPGSILTNLSHLLQYVSKSATLSLPSTYPTQPTAFLR